MEIIIGLLDFDSREHHESIALRDIVLRQPLGLAFSEEELRAEKKQYHVGAMINGSVVGILLLHPIDESVIKMRQVAVSPELQSSGIGKKLVNYAEELAQSCGFRDLVLHARLVSLPFYKSLNYLIDGEQFTEVGIEHYKMYKTLNAS